MPLSAAILAVIAREGIKRAVQKYGPYAVLIARKIFVKKSKKISDKISKTKKLKGEKQRREDKEEKQRQDYKRSVDKKFKDSLPKGNPRAWEKKKKPPGDELDRLERKEFVQGNLDRIKRQKKSVRKFREGTSEATTPDARTRRLSDALDTKAIDDFNKENSEPGDAPGITSGDVLRGNMESQKKHLLNAPAAATVVAGGAAAALLKKKKKQQQVEEPPLAKDFPEWGE